MTALERRCRLLLLAYPAAYRRERGAEMLGTLLEATPPRRTWPLLRDSRALVMGGLRARAGQSRRMPMAASLRLAVVLGLSVYLSVTAGTDLSGFLYAKLAPHAAPAGWPALAAGLLIAATVLLAWLARRSAAVAVALAAGAATAYDGFSPAFASWRDTPPVQTVAVLLSLAALAVLAVVAGRPPRLWLWLVGPAAAASVLAHLWDAIPSATFLVSALPWATMFLVAVSIAWIGADARPAMGLAVYLALLGLPNLAAVVEIGGGLQVALAELPWLELAIVLAVPALWRLRRQAVL